MDSKEGIEKVMPADAQAAGLLDASLLRSDPDDTVMCPKDTPDNLPHKQVGSPARLSTMLDGLCKWESHCLYVRVLRDSDAILDQDRKVPEHCWNAGICKDICEARTEVIPGTFSVDLLSDTEFLVYKLLKTGRGMTWAETIVFINLIRGGYLWAGIPAEVFAVPRTMPQAKRDKMKTRNYRCLITVEQLAVAQAQLQDLDLATQKGR